jgi:small-conductance mechanosensitive channel
MDDSAMILRVKFKTKPGDQLAVQREVYRRIQERFRAQGIESAIAMLPFISRRKRKERKIDKARRIILCR